MKISIIIPVFNERNTIEEIIQRVQSVKIEKELIIVDDGSTDGTREFLEGLKVENIRILFHERNTGKGSAIRTAQSYVNGDIVIIQDADLEYYPDEYPQLVKPIVEGKADAVFGSRFLGTHRVFYFWHYMGNRLLTT
ncbi:glycosyltransferase family 2 protein, partial [candidate division TA06 bacterium]|nr:glycosyltransferase family 2 protein [candidate division TA06 bacterium]